MIKPEDRLIEDVWYHVCLDDNPYRRERIKVEGKFHFIGKLIVHIGNQVVFNLQDGKGSVVLPFDFIKWMVPVYEKEKEKEKEKERGN